MKTLDINSKTWFDKINGNSYFASKLIIDYGTEKEKTIKLPFQYGYGSQDESEAKAVLTEKNLISTDYGQSLKKYCEDNGIIFRHIMQKNCKKIELKNI